MNEFEINRLLTYQGLPSTDLTLTQQQILLTPATVHYELRLVSAYATYVRDSLGRGSLIMLGYYAVDGDEPDQYFLASQNSFLQGLDSDSDGLRSTRLVTQKARKEVAPPAKAYQALLARHDWLTKNLPRLAPFIELPQPMSLSRGARALLEVGESIKQMGELHLQLTQTAHSLVTTSDPEAQKALAKALTANFGSYPEGHKQSAPAIHGHIWPAPGLDRFTHHVLHVLQGTDVLAQLKHRYREANAFLTQSATLTS